MIIGVPRERKTLEKRVALTPQGAKTLKEDGHTVLIETDAGIGSGYENSEYVEAGCTIVNTLKEVWTESEMLVKVKEPHESEYEYFRSGLLLFDYLHLAGLPEVTYALLEGGVTSVAYELVQTEGGRLPLLEPMSIIAGKLSVLNGANLLLTQNGGRGVLLSTAAAAPAGSVAIVGAGIAGSAACEIAVGMGADVTIFDINEQKLEELQVQYREQVKTKLSTQESLLSSLATTDLLIGAVLVPGAAAPKVITREMLRVMPKDSVFVDISIDQGGCAETIRTTSLAEPSYKEEGVIHYGVPNMPSQTARTSTMALTSATLPYIRKLAEKDSFNKYAELKEALNTHQGKLTNKAVSDAVDRPYTAISEALA